MPCIDKFSIHLSQVCTIEEHTWRKVELLNYFMEHIHRIPIASNDWTHCYVTSTMLIWIRV